MYGGYSNHDDSLEVEEFYLNMTAGTLEEEITEAAEVYRQAVLAQTDDEESQRDIAAKQGALFALLEKRYGE